MSLEINQLSVVYRDGSHSIQALEGISLELIPGKCLALVGESGSGKTTLGNACIGLLPLNAAREGEIKLNNERIDHLKDSAMNEIRWEKISMVFQNGAASLNPAHRIVDQVAEPLIQRRHLRRVEAIEKACEALEQMGFEHFYYDCYPHQLSGGQVQRALLATAMIMEPEVIILDEPTSALDALSKNIVAEVIQGAKRNNKSVLLITHDLEFAVHNSDTIEVLYLGQIVETLPSEDLLMRPLHPYTLALGRSYPAMSTTRDLGGIKGDAFYRLVHQHGHDDKEGYRHAHIQVPQSSHKNGHAPPTGCLFQNRCTQTIERCRTGQVDLEKIDNHTVRCLRHGIVNLLEFEGIGKTYEKTVALNPIDLAVKCGEVFSVVGETASGKTTLAMITAGMLKPDTGKRVFYGRDMDKWMRKDYRSLARKIGVIYQNPAESISHRFSVFEAVAEPLKIQGIGLSKAERLKRVSKVLEDVHLSTDPVFLDMYPHELNMGAIQRVSLARALVLGPSLLIADEPTSSLDPSVQAKVLKLLLDLQTEMGLTMLFVTHDIGLARKISDRIGVMLQGRLVEVGPANLVLSVPCHPYTRLLIDSVSGQVQGPAKLSSTATMEETDCCGFVKRCPQAKKLCWNRNPQVLESNYRMVACHFPLTSSRPDNSTK